MDNLSANKKMVTKPIRIHRKWDLSRKKFIQALVVGGIVSQFPIISLSGQDHTGIADSNQLEILISVQEILFPADGNGPGAAEINAADYLVWVLSDPEKDREEVSYITNGIGWVDETAIEEYSKNYNELSQTEKEILVAKISRETWGESWLSVILSFIFEALFCDPQYVGNPDGIGWNWLEHNAGQPRPTKELLYPKILTTIRKS